MLYKNVWCDKLCANVQTKQELTVTKHDVKRIFGTYAEAGRALGMTRSAVFQWPDVLPDGYADRVIGACVRTGKPIPADLLAVKSAAN